MLLAPERVQVVPRRRRPPSSSVQCCSIKRSLLCLLPPVGFILLQLLFVAYMSQEYTHRLHLARAAELEPTAPVQPTIQPAAAAEPAESSAAEPLARSEQGDAGGGSEEDGMDGTDGTGATPPGRPHGHGRRRKKRLVVVRRPINLTQEFVWDFSAATVRGEQTRLLGCLGRGTYGTVFNASYRADEASLAPPDAPAHAAALKVPLLRSWGFRFYRVELQVLLVLQGGGGGEAGGGGRDGGGGRGGAGVASSAEGHEQDARGGTAVEEGERNIIRLLGNTSVAASRLLELDDSEARWSCLNKTDLLEWPKVVHLPGMLLELLPRGSVFHALAALAAPEAVAQLSGLPPPPRLSLDAQRKVFKQRLQAARRPDAPFREAVEHPWDILLGLARGMRRMHARHVLHRDLTEPGKNVIIKRDAHGLTAALVDFSQAEQCSAGRGAGARAIESYAFGNVLYFACYGHVRRTVPWSKYSCDLPRPGLLELQLAHAKEQPTESADAAARFNRCASSLQPQLDALMRYCWQPTLDAAEALLRPRVAQRPSNQPANFSWDVVIAQLQTMHRIGTGRRPLFRFM